MDRPDCILVKIAPEITLKSPSVRKYFTDKLVKNIKSSLRAASLSGTRITRGEGRIYIFAEKEKLGKIPKLLEKSFGVYAFADARLISADSLSSVAEKITEIAGHELRESKTFAVRAAFPQEKNFRSKDVEVEAGSFILKALPHLKVNLGSPEKTVFAEGKKGKVFVYVKLAFGPGGLPVGCQGTVGVLFDGAEDAAISAWLMLKRGCSVFPIADGKTKKIEEQVGRLVQWNAGRKFKITSIDEIPELVEKPDISIKAIAGGGSAFTNALEKEKSGYAVPLYEPLLFLPAAMKKQIGAVLND